MLAGGVILLAADYAGTRQAVTDGVRRNSYGEGARREAFDVEVEDSGERIPVEVEVGEQKYTADEIQEMFDRVGRKLDKQILNGNESLDRVETDLDLVTGIPDEPVDIAWELDRYDVMNIQGEITEEVLEEEGTLVTLSALLTYREDETRQARHQCTVCLYPRTLKPGEAREQKIREELTEAEAKDREDKIWHLPRTIGGKAVSYYRQMDSRGAVLIGMALITGILLLAQKKQKEMQEETQRSRQLLRDYPEIVGKLTLYLGAGMTVKRAFRKVVEDYERQKETTGVRCAYEEMQKNPSGNGERTHRGREL